MANVTSVYLVLALVGAVSCQDFPVIYNAKVSTGENSNTVCPATHDVRENVTKDIRQLVKSSVIPSLTNTKRGHGACDCGGPGWRRAAYLNMSDPTQTCPPAWELFNAVATPKRSCGRPYIYDRNKCNSATFPTRGVQYSQVCGRIIAYQFGQPEAFIGENSYGPQPIDGLYVDGVSLTYGNPRQHIWTFANALDERGGINTCPCTNINSQITIVVPSFIGNDYFCETGVPPGQRWGVSTFYPDDPLWDGEGCGPTSTCCTFNNPPWFCKQLPQPTNADLEIRICSHNGAFVENTSIELIEIYTK